MWNPEEAGIKKSTSRYQALFLSGYSKWKCRIGELQKQHNKATSLSRSQKLSTSITTITTASIRYISLSIQPLFKAFRLIVAQTKAIFTFMIVGLLFSDKEKAMLEILL